jgi:hypothetical protein
MGFTKWMDSSSRLVKLILALPVLDIVWGIYRIAKALKAKNTLLVILGILMIIPGAAFIWVLDILCILLTGKILWID